MDEKQSKEWFRVQHGANGTTSVTVTIQEDNLSVKWSEKTYTHRIKEGLRLAKGNARRAMDDLKQALKELEDS